MILWPTELREDRVLQYTVIVFFPSLKIFILPYPPYQHWIGCYPITNSQLCTFIEYLNLEDLLAGVDNIYIFFFKQLVCIFSERLMLSLFKQLKLFYHHSILLNVFRAQANKNRHYLNVFLSLYLVFVALSFTFSLSLLSIFLTFSISFAFSHTLSLFLSLPSSTQ